MKKKKPRKESKTSMAVGEAAFNAVTQGLPEWCSTLTSMVDQNVKIMSTLAHTSHTHTHTHLQ